MKIHIVTIGEPKLAYAKQGWQEYFNRLKHYHNVRITHVPDKHAYDAEHLVSICGNGYKVALVITGKQLSSPELSGFLDKRALEGRELCFLVGGPEGLPQTVIDRADYAWSLAKLTFPHDLAMVILLEALYRASTITAGTPYHK